MNADDIRKNILARLAHEERKLVEQHYNRLYDAQCWSDAEIEEKMVEYTESMAEWFAREMAEVDRKLAAPDAPSHKLN